MRVQRKLIPTSLNFNYSDTAHKLGLYEKHIPKRAIPIGIIFKNYKFRLNLFLKKEIREKTFSTPTADSERVYSDLTRIYPP